MTHYDGLTRQLIREVKYTGKFHLALLLGRFVADRIDSLTDNQHYDLIIPVPSSLRHLQQRKFSLPAVIAKELSRHTKSKYYPMALQIENILTDKSLRRPLTDRIFKAPTIVPGINALPGKSVLLVDDVLTSGATISAAASCLRLIGAEKITALTLSVSKHYEFNRMLRTCARLPVRPVLWSSRSISQEQNFTAPTQMLHVSPDRI
ncbi:MAG: phosphoribosyltransferase family protein [bacterium]|nr:phosphoribosyltransferase family protein [bacterium]